MSKKDCCKDPRLGSVGGQAVLEGVMMRAGNRIALTVRDTSGQLKTDVEEIAPASSKYPILKWPLIRGVASFISTMCLSIRIMNKSVDMLGLEEDEPSKFEKWLDKHFGKSITAIATGIGTVLGLALSIFLFMYIPTVTAQWIFGVGELSAGLRLLKSCFNGVFKIAIFLAYIALVGLIPDIKRTFQYHGAEHKSVFCHEAYLPLTVENVKKQSRFHPRCGTSFLVVMMILGIFVGFFFVNIRSTLLQTCLRLLTLPIVVGLGYEFIRYAGRHDNLLVRILAAPGLWIQRLTTKEPDDSQIETAIQSLKAALPDDYPEIRAILENSDAPETPDNSNESSENVDNVEYAGTAESVGTAKNADASESSDSIGDTHHASSTDKSCDSDRNV